MADNLQIRGADELVAKLQNLAKKGAKAALRKSTRKGANVVLREARARAPVGPTGNYSRGIKLKPKQKGNIVSTWVRATAPHSALVEWGSKDRTTKGGHYTGKMPALGIMTAVARDVGQQALDVAVAALKTEIEAAAQGDGSGGG